MFFAEQNTKRKTYTRGGELFNLSLIKHVPKSVLALFLSLHIIGLACLYSSANGSFSPWAIKQFIFFLLFIPLFVAIVCIDNEMLANRATLFFILSFLLVLSVAFVGRKTMGASRWIDLGVVKVQPSEVLKVAFVIFLASFFSRIYAVRLRRVSAMFFVFMIFAIAILPVAIQPDFATSMLILATGFIMFFVAGFPLKSIIVSAILFVISLPIIWFKFLREYQKLRVINFLFPENDPLGSGYNVIQSKIALGSGGFFGKGFLAGTQGKLRFLPEHHTDFIFTIVGEEFGFIGCAVVISIYIFFIFYGINVVYKTKSVFEKMICVGCSTLIFLHTFINIGMTAGLLPVAGIPLIMLSYGGSGLLLFVLCIALIVNVDVHNR